jgi:hypothetical protein
MNEIAATSPETNSPHVEEMNEIIVWRSAELRISGVNPEISGIKPPSIREIIQNPKAERIPFDQVWGLKTLNPVFLGANPCNYGE